MTCAKPSFFVVAILFSLLSCKSKPIRLPQPDISPETQKRWLENYKAAKNFADRQETQKACPLFSELAKEAKFPARKVAQLRQILTCEASTAATIQVSDFPPYLEDLAIEAGLTQARRNGDKQAEMDFAALKSKQRLAQKEKIEWIRRALELAQELKAEDKIKDLQKRLYTVSPRLNPDPKPSDWLMVASDYRANREFARAREFYEQIIQNKTFSLEDKIAAHKGLRLAQKNARNNDGHLEASRRLVRFLAKSLRGQPSATVRRAYFDAQIFYARALWTQGKSQEAAAIFASLEKTLRGKLSLAEVHWLRGRMAEEKNNFAEVGEHLQKALGEATPGSELHEKVIWYSAWNEWRRKDFEKAASLLREIDEKTQSEFTRVRALFWLGKTLEGAKKEEDAKATFERLVELDPLGYYGLLARRQLGMAISLETKTPVQIATPEIPLDNALAEWLAMLEESEALTELLDRASLAYKKHANQSDEGWVAFFKFYARGGLYMKLYESLGSLSPERRKSILDSNPELLFPQPWSEEVRTSALQFGVAEELIYSIMRQESAFNTKARSVADAFGLMQIIPEVAERLSRQNRVNYKGMDDLYTPAINITLGAAHIKELLTRHKSQFILAVASYNANENAIRNWMSTRYRGDAVEFIEEIPYEETRAYVRLVMRNLIFYSLLKSKSASIEFPAWVLKLDPS